VSKSNRTQFNSTVSQKFNRSLDSLSTLGCAIEVLLPIAIVQARFGPDVAHPITDVRLYKGEGGGELYATDRFLNVKDSASLSKTLDPPSPTRKGILN